MTSEKSFYVLLPQRINLKCEQQCSPVIVRLGGAGLGYFLTGKLGCAWVIAWVGIIEYSKTPPTQNAHTYTKKFQWRLLAGFP